LVEIEPPGVSENVWNLSNGKLLKNLLDRKYYAGKVGRQVRGVREGKALGSYRVEWGARFEMRAATMEKLTSPEHILCV